MDELKMFTSLITERELPDALLSPEKWQTQPLPGEHAVDLGPFRQTWEKLQPGNTERDRAAWDRELAPPLHQALRDLAHREAADLRFWHWLCIVSMPSLVWQRWYGSIPRPEQIAGILKSKRALAGRFLGRSTLAGVSRNALARLWWCAEMLWSPADQYRLVQVALTNQDLFQAVFERKLGIYQPAARACFRVLEDKTLNEGRELIVRVNHLLTTVTLEALEEDEIVSVLERELGTIRKARV